MNYRWEDIEQELLDQFRLGQITKAEFVRLHEERLNYDHDEAERYADETIEFLEQMAER